MNRILKAAAAVTMTLGLAVMGLPFGFSDGGTVSPLTGSTGCCRQ